ncbi:MAG: tyrosine-type recombinase/integrase [Lachnospiraceae bacterium]|nr:tyrosine-type recombinase/integrase [Lachnospiraceae bacterium]
MFAKDRDVLLQKLFDYYTKREEQQTTYSLEDLYPEWIAERKTLRPSETTDHNIQDWQNYLEGTDFSKTDVKEITVALWSDFSLHLVGNGKGELKALHWSDYNEEAGTLYIHRSIVYRKAYDEALGREVKRPKELPRTKGKKKEANRILPLTENAVMALNILKGLSNGCEYVVTNNAGNTIDTSKYNSWIKRYCDKAGIREHSSHDSRRYAISALLDSGVPLETVKTFAGHLETSTTASYFRRIQDNKFNEAFINALN